jgi:hypothetical protein
MGPACLYELLQRKPDDWDPLVTDGFATDYDVERSKRESPFGDTVAHGFLTLSLFLLSSIKMTGAWLASATLRTMEPTSCASYRPYPQAPKSTHIRASCPSSHARKVPLLRRKWRCR